MRKFGKKRLVAVMTAIAMATSMMGSMSAMAASVTVQVDGSTDIWGTDPEFTAYRVFTGVDSNGTLTNIGWSTDFASLATNTDLLELVYGNGHTQTEVTAAAVADYLTDSTDQATTPEARAEAFAKIANSIVTNTTTGVSLIPNTSQELEAGYYLIVNTTIGTSENGEPSGVRNPIVMEVTSDGDIVIKAKTNRPRVEKKIWEERLEDQSANTVYELPEGDSAIDTYINGIDDSTQWNDVADYDIGDKVPFKLMATIPAGTTTDYSTYKVVFHDTMDSNLKRDMNGNHYLVYAQQGNGELVYVDPNSASEILYTVSFPNNTNDIDIEFPDIFRLNGFQPDQELKLYVFFTAELTSGAVAATGEENEVVLEFSNDYTTNGTGKTEKDQVVAITFDTIIDKYTKTTGNNHVGLAGATFKLYRVKDKTATMSLATTVVDEANGIYDLTDTATLANLEPVYYSSHSTNQSGVETYVVGQSGDSTFTTTDKNLIIHGLDRDQYLLVETNAPAGYNILKAASVIDIENVTAYDRDSYEDEQYTANGAIEYTVSLDGESQADGIVSVLNSSGSTLPETGGTGTMVLYILGTALMAGGVFFLTAKGKKKEELQ